jgi:CDP-diacylglycerol---serine O-phosphatidyltransferase
MNIIAKGLPSFFTSLALISGCISVVLSTTRGDLTLAGYFVLISAALDFVDGMAARLLHSMSEFGKQLDSLADVVSFGVAPAMILYRLILYSFTGGSLPGQGDLLPWEVMILYSPFLVAAFSALRLAKFNLDLKQVKNFRGLPTPANGLFIVALGFASESRFPFLQEIAYSLPFLLIVIVLSCFMLVCNLPMFSLKLSSFGFRENSLRYLLILCSVLLLALCGLSALAAIILLYILLSLADNWLVKMP